jgi:lysophospholipase L1-like esterase
MVFTSIQQFTKQYFIAISSILLMCSFIVYQKNRPVLYIIGDSTVKNGDGTGKDTLWGWGSFMKEHFDSTKIDVQNHAIGGRSTRTFITDKRWDRILTTLKKGDYVMIQFGHNDASPLDDTARARGTIRGNSDDSVEIYNPIRKVKEIVHSYGWYLRKFISETKQVGAIPVICSLVPRNNFTNGKTNRSNDYAAWAKEVCEQTNTYYIDLNSLIADKYDALGEKQVNVFFPKDHTHTNKDGALLNTQIVIEAIHQNKAGRLKKYLLKD